jgi:hypothetical protein
MDRINVDTFAHDGDSIMISGTSSVEMVGNYFYSRGEASAHPLISFDGTNLSVRDAFMMPLGLARQEGVIALVSAPRGLWCRMWHAVARFALRRVA